MGNLNNGRVLFECPNYSSPTFFTESIYYVKPTRSKEGVLKEKIFHYKNFQYEVVEFTEHPEEPGLYIYHLKSLKKNNHYGFGECHVEIDENGISKSSLKDFHKSKWLITDDFKKFPKELLKYLYDKNQTTLFGSITTKATIKYRYIPKEYMKNNIPFLIGWEQSFDGSCDLKDKETTTWEELRKIFTENKFSN